ncbi:hypothetical protein POM88_028533 [Heracleum sosnowskyi]|uniref:Protein root UVB sensitive/RUS domain-containing protein n=1 Tax=Heracleum sosnowskyi TaxID=360622 RepID=A0AAD8HUJ3_9APIA|nr:hypothetical protein POM88_028533 [Heracleum sosnowskyi]
MCMSYSHSCLWPVLLMSLRMLLLGENIGDVTAKGECVGNIANVLGTGMSIMIAKRNPSLVTTFALLSCGYVFSSYQEVKAVVLHTLNRARFIVAVDSFLKTVQVDVARHENAVQANMDLEFQRNSERFAFLKWGSTTFQNMLVRIKTAKSNKPLPGQRTRSRANAPIEIEKESTRAATTTEKQPKKAGTNREATSSYRPPVLIILRAWCWHLHLKNL